MRCFVICRAFCPSLYSSSFLLFSRCLSFGGFCWPLPVSPSSIFLRPAVLLSVSFPARFLLSPSAACGSPSSPWLRVLSCLVRFRVVFSPSLGAPPSFLVLAPARCRCPRLGVPPRAPLLLPAFRPVWRALSVWSLAPPGVLPPPPPVPPFPFLLLPWCVRAPRFPLVLPALFRRRLCLYCPGGFVPVICRYVARGFRALGIWIGLLSPAGARIFRYTIVVAPAFVLRWGGSAFVDIDLSPCWRLTSPAILMCAT